MEGRHPRTKGRGRHCTASGVLARRRGRSRGPAFLRKNSASRVRFRPPLRRTFGFRLRPTGLGSTYSRPVLAARGNLGRAAGPVKTRPNALRGISEDFLRAAIRTLSGTRVPIAGSSTRTKSRGWRCAASGVLARRWGRFRGPTFLRKDPEAARGRKAAGCTALLQGCWREGGAASAAPPSCAKIRKQHADERPRVALHSFRGVSAKAGPLPRPRLLAQKFSEPAAVSSAPPTDGSASAYTPSGGAST
jgi:hypothetical protein